MSHAAMLREPPPQPHYETTSAAHSWIRCFEEDPQWQECENRPWANHKHAAESGCIGQDFVKHNPRVHLRFFWNESTKQLGGVIHWDKDSEGPPKGAHGASIAMVFDEILAYPIWRSGTGAFTANLNVNLRRMVPHNSTQRFIAGIQSRNGRKIITEGKILSPDEKTVYADCKGLWIEAAHMSATQRPKEENKAPVAQSKL